jgi:YaiO family outer membrane protein
MKRGRSPISACPQDGAIAWRKSGNVPFVMFLVLLAPPALACDAALEAQVAAEPANDDARDALARSCAKAGRHAEALAQYDTLLTRDPANVDWLLGKSQALVALGRPREALPLLEDGRRRAPAYEDVWRLNARALDALDEFDRADALLNEATTQFPRASWPSSQRRALAERRLLEHGSKLSADLSYEDVSGGRPAWKGASVGLDTRLGGPRHLFTGLHLEERFDTRDTQVQLGYADRLDDDWSYGVSADITPGGDILPRWSLAAEAGRALPDDWGINLRLRHAHHEAVDVDTLATTVEKYLGAFSVGYSLNVAKTSDIEDPSFGHLLRAGHDYGDANRAALVVGFGEEAETIAPGVVQVTDTKSVALSGLHWASTRWGISWEAGWYEQGDLYDRFRVRLGLEHRF